MPEPIDIILLTHNRLDHLVKTVTALRERTPEPIRITIVDNASRPDLRNWLAEHRDWFHQVILRPTNEHVPAFQHGIDATTSDPYIVCDPDIVVPDLEPSWLARQRSMMDRHPDFGLIGIGCDPVNRPAVLPPEVIDPATVVDDEIVETTVGTVMQMIRREALLTPYTSDWRTCTNIQRAGWRLGWARDIRGIHLGWDDHVLHPSHLAAKHLDYGDYREVELIQRPPTLTELAQAAPILALTRGAGIADEAVLELAWRAPAVGVAAPAAVSAVAPPAGALRMDDGAADAVVLLEPPTGSGAALVAEAARVAGRLVVALAELAAFGGATAQELAPPGWTGREAPGPGDVEFALARHADGDPALAPLLGPAVLEDRDRWLRLFGEATFGTGGHRLWIWEPERPAPLTGRVDHDPARLVRWAPTSPPAPRARQRAVQRFWKRADVVERWRIHALVRRRDRG